MIVPRSVSQLGPKSTSSPSSSAFCAVIGPERISSSSDGISPDRPRRRPAVVSPVVATAAEDDDSPADEDDHRHDRAVATHHPLPRRRPPLLGGGAADACRVLLIL